MIDFASIRLIDIETLETSNKQKKYLACYKERFFEVGSHLALLIDVLKRSDSPEEAAALYAGATGGRYTAEQIGELAERYLQPVLESENSAPKRPLLVKMELLKGRDIDRLTRWLGFLFSPVAAVPLLIGIAALEILFFSLFSMHFSIGQVDMYVILGALGLYLLSSLFHELGHATACRHYGVSQGGIGFGLYLNFPVFYTDVSSVWKLRRRQRIVVNMAGTYFQLILLIPFIVGSLYTNNPIVKYFVLTVNLNFLITLNPFFKFDGYWIMSDLLGVPNLRKRTNELFKYLFARLRGREPEKKPFLLTMKKTERAFMLVYSAVVNLFFGYYFCYLLPLFLYRFCSTFPSQAYELVTQLASGATPDFPLIRTLFAQLLFAGFFGYFAYKMIKKPIVRYRRRKTENNLTPASE